MESNTHMRDKLLKENSNLVHSICSKYTNYMDKEDLYQVGMIGLIKAYNNFDSKKDVKFSTYAFNYVVGEVNNYVRENKSVKLSRDLIRLGRKINEYINKHYEVRGYEPSINEIASILSISKARVIGAIEASNMVKSKSLDSFIDGDEKNLTLLDMTPANENNVSKEEMMDLKEAFKYLSYEEKNLVINRYFKDLTQSEVAEILGVNQVYVSRLEKKALTKMKSKMVS